MEIAAPPPTLWFDRLTTSGSGGWLAMTKGIGGPSMAALNPQAIELNRLIRHHNPVVYQLLSQKGKAIYFPPKASWRRARPPKTKKSTPPSARLMKTTANRWCCPAWPACITIDSKDVFPYAPSEGIKTLREKWQELMLAKNPSLGKGRNQPARGYLRRDQRP